MVDASTAGRDHYLELLVIYRSVTEGLAFNRELLLLYIATGLIAASIGRGRTAFAVLCDWLPFALFLLLYDLSRGATALIGAPTLWRFQPEADRWLFFGTIPTVWLQERIKMPQPPWWEVIISGIYMSFFVLPYVVAGVLWLRNRRDWAAFIRRFVALCFAALIIYIVMPAAPPWAEARCTPAEIVGGPSNPHCMYRSPAGVHDGGLLGAMHTSQPGAHHFVERISTRGYGTLHLQSAGALVNSGQVSVNLVAAIPSLHAALTAMISVFLWRRVRPGGARYWWLIRWRWPSCWCIQPSTSWLTSCWAGHSPRSCCWSSVFSSRHGPDAERRSQPSPNRLSQSAILLAASP